MNSIIKRLKRLFFYPSRQLYRRRRTYRSIFVTSVILLTLVMTFLEMVDANSLKNTEQVKNGYYHASFLEQSTDFSDDMTKFSRVKTAFSIPYTSRMASSDDTSVPAKLVVCNDDIAEFLEVSYLWGSPPADGEIAVTADVYRAYGYLVADEVNDFYFKASEMTYFPLRISGIFETNDNSVGYAFVTKNTADAIDAETGAHELYDTYITCKNTSDKYIAQVVEKIIKEYRIPNTDSQSRYANSSTILDRHDVYKEYINNDYLRAVLRGQATPSVLISMPLILVAAMIMALFMINQTMRNTPEYGILGTVGANRRQLCTLAAGQILILSLIASVPVIIVSAVISNTYIYVYNLSLADTALRFGIPWWDLICAALWFDVFSCVFTYIGISKMTLQPPFTLISGSYKSLPFVKRTSHKSEKGRHRIFRISLLQTMREIRGQILPSVTTSVVCMTLGVFIVAEAVLQMVSNATLTSFGEYAFDGCIEKTSLITSARAPSPIYDEVIDSLKSLPEFERGGVYSHISADYFYSDSGYSASGAFILCDDEISLPCKTESKLHYKNYKNGYYAPAIVCDEVTLPILYTDIVAGDPTSLFTEKNTIVLIDDGTNDGYGVGDTVLLCGGYERIAASNTVELYSEPVEFTIVAVASASSYYRDVSSVENGTILMSNESAVAIGLANPGEYDSYLFDFHDDETSTEKLLSFYDTFRQSPSFIRYDCSLYSVESYSARLVRIANTVMLSLFFFMVFLSLCTMTFVDSSLRIEKKKSEIAVLRQVGATDRDIHKTTRAYILPGAIIAFAITTVVYILVFYIYTTRTSQNINMQIEMYHPSESTITRWREELRVVKIILTGVYLAALPMHILTYVSALLGITLPTKRVLRETIASGLRKDTD